MCTLNANKGSAAADPISRALFRRRRPPSSGHFAAAEQAGKQVDEQLPAWLTVSKIVDFNGTGIKCYYNSRFAFLVLVGVTTFMQKTGYKVIRLDFT